MKKHLYYLGIIGYISLTFACTKAVYTPPKENNPKVTISTNISSEMHTRNQTGIQLPGYTMRYILEVWDNTTQEQSLIRMEKTVSDGKSPDFSFELENSGSYLLLIWADFIKENEAQQTGSNEEIDSYPDLYYKTNNPEGLKNIEIIPDNYIINDESRDAFFVCKNIYKEESAFEETVILTRPFGQLNIIEKKETSLEYISGLTLKYQVPQSFNLATGLPGKQSITIQENISQLPEPTDLRKANLVYDFIFATPTGNNIPHEIQLEFSSANPSFIVRNFTIQDNQIPIVRNKRTNVRGNIIHTATTPDRKTTISITIANQWNEPTETFLSESLNAQISDFINQNNPFQ